MANKHDFLDLKEMRKKSQKFVKERDWEKYHSPKNLAIGISIESSELNEIFHWLTDQDSFLLKENPAKIQKIKDEIGDILHYIIRLSDLLEIDLNEAYWDKFHKTIKKYPVSLVKGHAEMYEKLHSGNLEETSNV